MTNLNLFSAHEIIKATDNYIVDSMMKLPPCLCALHRTGLL